MNSSDLKMMLPAEDSASATNGGRITATAVTSNVLGNTWPPVTPAELSAGGYLYRKRFLQAADDADGTLYTVRAWLDKETPGDDWCTMFAGSHTDELGDITGYATGADTETKYGVAPLKTDVTAGTRTIVVTVPTAKMLSTGDDEIFRVGGLVRLTKQTTPSNSETTTYEWLTIDSISESGNDITVVVTTDIVNSYTVAAGSRLCSVLELSDLVTSHSAVGHTGGADYDATTFPPLLDNIGTWTQRLVFTFSDASNFTCVGDSMGNLGTGNVSTDFTITNSAAGKPLFTLEAGGWSGLTISAGDTFTIDIVGAYAGIWRKRETPAGATASLSNQTVLCFYGASL